MFGRSTGWVALYLAVTMFAADAEWEMAKNPPRVELSVNRKRHTKVGGGDWDDRTQKVQMEVSVKNLDLNKPVGGLRCEYWALAESLEDRKNFKVIERGKFDVELSNLPDGRTVTHEGREIILKWDDTGAKFGERYKGFVAVILNDANEVVAVAANQPTWEREFRRAFQLSSGAWCDSGLRPVSR